MHSFVVAAVAAVAPDAADSAAQLIHIHHPRHRTVNKTHVKNIALPLKVKVTFFLYITYEYYLNSTNDKYLHKSTVIHRLTT